MSSEAPYSIDLKHQASHINNSHSSLSNMSLIESSTKDIRQTIVSADTSKQTTMTSPIPMSNMSSSQLVPLSLANSATLMADAPTVEIVSRKAPIPGSPTNSPKLIDRESIDLSQFFSPWLPPSSTIAVVSLEETSIAETTATDSQNITLAETATSVVSSRNVSRPHPVPVNITATGSSNPTADTFAMRKIVSHGAPNPGLPTNSPHISKE